MIFVTVGTHEQGFDRLIKKIDELKGKGVIDEQVIIQKGYTKYEPKYCETYEIIDYENIQRYLKEARIVVTHGGPASFIAPLSIGKIPIVVPRQKKYYEHVNNHQVDFVKQVVERYNYLIPVYDINDLEYKIKNYERIIAELGDGYVSNNKKFVEKLEYEVIKIFE